MKIISYNNITMIFIFLLIKFKFRPFFLSLQKFTTRKHSPLNASLFAPAIISWNHANDDTILLYIKRSVFGVYANCYWLLHSRSARGARDGCIIIITKNERVRYVTECWKRFLGASCDTHTRLLHLLYGYTW